MGKSRTRSRRLAPLPTTIGGGLYTGAEQIQPGGPKWSDLNYDEKIEKLMNKATQLWRRVNRLERENQRLKYHLHDSKDGYPYTKQGIDTAEYDEDGPWQDDNPFNVAGNEDKEADF